MPALSATVYPAEAYVLLQGDWAGTILRDTFRRVATQLWAPAADTGQVWALQSGANADFPIIGFRGNIIHSAIGTTKRLLSPIAADNINASGWFANTVTPTGDDFTYQVMGRFVDINNLVDVRFRMDAAGTFTLILRQRIAAVDTTTTVVVAGLPTSGAYRWRFLAQGPLLAARIWLDGQPEPGFWHATLTTTHLVAGSFVTGSVLGPGVTNPVPVTFLVKDILVTDPDETTSDCALVTRRNTVTGEVVSLRPYVFYDEDGALILECGQGVWWDTEPPLNVPLEYCLSACDTETVRTANPTFDGGTAGWTVFGGALTQDCTVAKVGACSGRLTPTGVDIEPSLSQTGFALTAGLQTTVSTWVRSSQGWNGVYLRLSIVYTDFTTETIFTPVEILDDTEWRYLSATFTPRTSVSSTTLGFIVTGTPANTNLFNVDELQVTQTTEVVPTDCVTVTVENDSVWLKSPLHPCDDVEIGLCSPMLQDCDEESRVSYVGTFDEEYSPNTAILSPVNRRHPIPISRTRRDAVATLRLLAHDCNARDAILEANEPGDELFFQAPGQYCIPDRYISVGVVSDSHISVDQREQFRLMTLPYVTVARPEGPMDGPCGARIDDLCDIYTSWAAMGIAGLNWTDLLLGEASPNGPGQPDPPEGARIWDDVETEFVDWDDVEAGGTRDWDELRDGL